MLDPDVVKLNDGSYKILFKVTPPPPLPLFVHGEWWARVCTSAYNGRALEQRWAHEWAVV